MLKPARETREHTGSYYAASVGSLPRWPSLAGEVSADVVVVGGGFSGVATALELAQRGMDVVLLEANRIGWGASGRNGGQLIGGLGDDPDAFAGEIGADGVREVHAMGIECVDIVRERVTRYAIDCDLVWGYCDVALKPRHLDGFAAHIEHLARIGAPFTPTLLDRDELRAYVNSPVYVGGAWHEGWGHLHPLKLCLGEARAAESLGVRLFERSRVDRIGYGSRPSVHTARGRVQADQVVLAGNAYLGRLVPRLDARIMPVTSCIVATRPLTDDQVADSLPRNLAVCDARTALDYFRLSSDRRLLFGGLANYTGLEPADVAGVMRRKLIEVFPALRGVPIDYAWSGQIGISVRRMPQVGRCDENVFYVQGFSGHGVAPSHITARVLAEAIAGDPRRFDVLAAMRHPAFPGGRLFRRTALAIGMSLYKLRDRF